MLIRRRTLRVAPSLALLLAITMPAVLLSSCSGDGASSNEAADTDGSGEATPEEVLALAKSTLDETSGVRFSLSTDALPEGVTGLTGATGVATRAPAFEGEITVDLSGNAVKVPVVSVDGTTYAQLPLVPGYQDVDPAEYGAPDPGLLLDPDEGVSPLLTATEGVTEGETVRGGADNAEILTEYSGTVTDEVMTNLIPTAQGDFEVTYTITEDGELRTATLDGVFYGDAEPTTYVVSVDDYGTEQEIVAP